MANVTSGTAFPLRMDEIDLSNLVNGTVTEATGSRVRVQFEPGDYVDFGGAFSFDSLGALTGQLTSVTEVRDGAELYRVTGFQVPVSTFLTRVEQGMTEEAKAHILGGADRIAGSPFDDVLQGYDGDDVMLGGRGADVLYGDDGNDVLSGGAGADFIDGGLGTDTAEAGGFRRHFDVDLATGSASSTRAGSDALTSIETMAFRDGDLTVDIASSAAQVFRLYHATLNRLPDPEGLAGWTGALQTGALSLQGAANAFVASAEFVGRYGVVSDEQFVHLLYQNVLGREPDAPGLASWLQYMAGGASRAQVVLGFSESPEHVGGTAATIRAGLWVEDQTASTLARLYDTALGRLPDAGGLDGWMDLLASGAKSLQSVADAFVASAEFQSRYGQVSNEDFVELLYRNALHREAEPTGLAGWTQALDSGFSRAEVVLLFSESPEHKGLTAAHIDNGLWFA